MAITKDYLNTSDLNTLATWMRTNLVPDYFAAVTVESGVITCTDADGNTLLTKGSNSLTAYKSASASAGISPHAGMQTVTEAYNCANGALLVFSNGTYTAHVLITKTNNGATAIVFSQPTIPGFTNGISSVAWGDILPNNAYAFTALTANQTQLVPFCTDAALGTVSYTPNAFYIPVGQYRAFGVMTLDGVNYLTNGYWAIKDE